jgi:hypothetical protein
MNIIGNAIDVINPNIIKIEEQNPPIYDKAFYTVKLWMIVFNI